MRLLLDTQVLLWMLHAPERLAGPLRQAAELRTNQLLVSDAAVWEIALRRAAGAVDVPDDLIKLLPRLGCDLLPVTREEMWATADLPRLHDDALDRLMIVQALRHELTFATADRAIWRYGPACLLNVWRT